MKDTQDPWTSGFTDAYPGNANLLIGYTKAIRLSKNDNKTRITGTITRVFKESRIVTGI